LHKLDFDNQLVAGQNFRFIQHCSTDIDSVVQGTINFEKTKIGKINDCKSGFMVLNDTIRHYYIKTFSKKESKNLIEQSISIYGRPQSIVRYKRIAIYFWCKTVNNKQIVSTIVESKKGRKAILNSITN
jgi:hypothetical protein